MLYYMPCCLTYSVLVIGSSDYSDCPTVSVGDNNNQVTYTSGNINGTNFRSAPVTVCVDEEPYTLCTQGLNNTVASWLCQYNGYNGPAYATPLFGSESDFRPSTTSRAIYDISCPYGYFNTYDCTYGLDDTGNGCDAYGGRAVITCFEEGKISTHYRSLIHLPV